MKINCAHHRGDDDCGLGLAADEACLRRCPSRVPIEPDVPGCYPTLPPRPYPTPPQPIPEGFDPEEERARMRQGGCCGAPSRPGE